MRTFVYILFLETYVCMYSPIHTHIHTQVHTHTATYIPKVA